MQVERRGGDGAIWTLDKRISLPVVVALLANMIAGIWFAAGVVSTQNQHSRDIATIKNDQLEIRRASDKMIRLEVLMEGIVQRLSQLDTPRKTP